MLFKDIDKSILKILDEDYNTNHNVRVNTTNSSGGTFTALGEIGAGGMESSIDVKTETPLEGIVLEKLNFKSDGKISVEAGYKVNNSFRFNFVAEDGRHEPGLPLNSFGKVGVEYLSNNMHSTFDVDVINGPLVFISSLFQLNNNISVGGSMQFNTRLETGGGPPNIVDLAIGASVKQKDWQAGVRTTKNLNYLRGSYLHNLSRATKIATSIDMNLRENHQNITVGGLHQVDKYTSMKAKIDSESRLSTSFMHYIGERKDMKISAAASVDLVDWAPNKQIVGFGISYDP